VVDVVLHVRHGRDEVEIELALEPLLTISMWSSPRNPQRNPKPRAVEVSGS